MRFITETYIKNETAEPVNEVYFGLIKEIQEMIDILHELRVKYIDRPNVGGSYIFYGSNSDPMLNVLATKFESLFGFGVLDLNVVNQSAPNAWTHPVCYTIGENPSENIKSNSKGFYFDKKLNYAATLCITSNVIFNKDYTDKEVLAIMLHEIGHSFVEVQESMVPLVAMQRTGIVISCILLAIIDLIYLRPISAMKDLLQLVYSTKIYKIFKASINKNLRNSPFSKMINSLAELRDASKNFVFNTIFENIYYLLGMDNINKVINLIFSGFIFTKGKSRDSLIKNMRKNQSFGRSMEYFSDNFAASYGLGPDFQSGMEKLEFGEKRNTAKELANLLPWNKALDEFTKLPYYQLAMSADPHPTYTDRTKKIISDLEDELKKSNMSPKLRKELEKNIKDMKEMDKNFKKVASIINTEEDAHAYKKLWMIALSDDKEWLSDEEKSYTSMEDRDKFYEKVKTENAELFNNYHDHREFDYL